MSSLGHTFRTPRKLLSLPPSPPTPSSVPHFLPCTSLPLNHTGVLRSRTGRLAKISATATAEASLSSFEERLNKVNWESCNTLLQRLQIGKPLEVASREYQRRHVEVEHLEASRGMETAAPARRNCGRRRVGVAITTYSKASRQGRVVANANKTSKHSAPSAQLPSLEVREDSIEFEFNLDHHPFEIAISHQNSVKEGSFS
jgi:hypothetical protein